MADKAWPVLKDTLLGIFNDAELAIHLLNKPPSDAKSKDRILAACTRIQEAAKHLPKAPGT